MKIDLWHGDCLEKMKDIPDKSVDMILTDPPYRLVQGGRVGSTVFVSQHEIMKKGKLFTECDTAFKDFLPPLFRILKDKSHCYIMVNSRNLKDLQVEAERVGFKFQNLLVWDKSNKTPGRYYMQQLEFILMLTKNGSKNVNNMGTGNLLSFKNIIGKKDHPTEKPVNLLECLISNSSNLGDTVIDMFMGSGSTGVACKNLNRNFIGIEKDDKYFEIAKNRIESHNGKT